MKTTVHRYDLSGVRILAVDVRVSSNALHACSPKAQYVYRSQCDSLTMLGFGLIFWFCNG